MKKPQKSWTNPKYLPKKTAKPKPAEKPPENNEVTK